MKTQTLALAALLVVAGIGMFATEAAARPLPTEDCTYVVDENGAAVACRVDGVACFWVTVGDYRFYCTP